MKSLVPASFYVTKGGSDQTGLDGSSTKITFGTEVYDVGSYFSSDKWTPPAGFIYLGARIKATGSLLSDTGASLNVFKNGSSLQVFACHQAPNTTAWQTLMEAMDYANGTDYYEIYIQLNLSSGTGTVVGDPVYTAFHGMWISP